MQGQCVVYSSRDNAEQAYRTVLGSGVPEDRVEPQPGAFVCCERGRNRGEIRWRPGIGSRSLCAASGRRTLRAAARSLSIRYLLSGAQTLCQEPPRELVRRSRYRGAESRPAGHPTGPDPAYFAIGPFSASGGRSPGELSHLSSWIPSQPVGRVAKAAPGLGSHCVAF